MSKSKNETALVDPNTFMMKMPNAAPPVKFDINDPLFNWRMILTSNYWNMDALDEKKREMGGWPVFTPLRMVVKPVYDPSDYDENEPIPPEALIPRLVMEFAEAVPGVVMNKSRCEMVSNLTGTPDPRRWVERLGPVVLLNGIYNKKAQICIEAAPRANGNGKGNPGNAGTVEDINDDLFGN